MKKIILLLILSANIYAQTYVAQIDSIKPNIVCNNEKITFYAHFSNDWSPTIHMPIQDSLGNVLANFTYQQWVDSNFVISYVNYGILSTGVHAMTLPDLNYFPCKKLTVNNCTANIQTHTSTDELISTEYYNLLGQPISEPNGITVEIKTYKGGYREARKVIK
jgi:hypothetical protein